LVLVVFTALISGVSVFVNSFAVQGTNSDAFITVRNLLVAGMLVPLAFFVRPANRTPLLRKDWVRLAAIGLVGGAIPFVLFFRGLSMAGAAGADTASFLYRTLFLMAAVLGIVVLREKVSARLALGGVALLAGNALLLSLTSPIWTDGTALVLAATLLWAVEYTMSKHALRDLPSRTVALGRMGFGGVFLFAYLAASGQLGAVAAFSGAHVQWILISGVLLLAFVSTWYAGLKHVDLSTATAVLVLAFPVTWALKILAAKEAFGLAEAAGAAVVVFGVCLAVGLAAMRDTAERVVRVLLREAPRA
jgi:drug/metabolite transporter (DMT)-like permease